jgi:hypothetical protein
VYATANSQITLPTRAYSLKRTGGPKPAEEAVEDDKMADGEDDSSEAVASATLTDYPPRGRHTGPVTGDRDTSRPSERTIVDRNVDQPKASA